MRLFFRAWNIRRALNMSDPGRSISGDAKYLYVKRSEERSDIEQIKRFLKHEQEFAKVLVTGNPGSGKTVELQALSADKWVRRRFHVGFVSGYDTGTDAKKIVIGALKQIKKMADAEGLNDEVKGIDLLLTQSLEWEPTVEVSGPQPKDKIDPKLFGPIQNNGDYRIRFTRKKDGKLAGPGDIFRTIAEAVDKIIAKNRFFRKSVLIIVTNLTGFSLDDALNLFRDNSTALNKPKCYMLYTCPLSITYHEDWGMIKNQFADVYHVTPFEPFPFPDRRDGAYSIVSMIEQQISCRLHAQSQLREKIEKVSIELQRQVLRRQIRQLSDEIDNLKALILDYNFHSPEALKEFATQYRVERAHLQQQLQNISNRSEGDALQEKLAQLEQENGVLQKAINHFESLSRVRIMRTQLQIYTELRDRIQYWIKRDSKSRHIHTMERQSSWLKECISVLEQRIADYEALKSILMKRIHERLFETPDIIDDLIVYSGGLPGEMLRLVRQCCLLFTNTRRWWQTWFFGKIDRSLLTEVINNRQRIYKRGLTQERIIVLQTVRRTSQYDDLLSPDFQFLVREGLIIQYGREDGIDRWFGIHPLVEELLPSLETDVAIVNEENSQNKEQNKEREPREIPE